MQVSVVSFKKGQLQVLAHSWDRDLGGRDFDEALFDYWVKEFDAKFKLDVRSSPRASFRLRLACEKVRHRADQRILLSGCVYTAAAEAFAASLGAETTYAACSLRISERESQLWLCCACS